MTSSEWRSIRYFYNTVNMQNLLPQEMTNVKNLYTLNISCERRTSTELMLFCVQTECYVQSYLLFYLQQLLADLLPRPCLSLCLCVCLLLKTYKKLNNWSPEMMTLLACCLNEAADSNSFDEFSSFSCQVFLLFWCFQWWSYPHGLITIL